MKVHPEASSELEKTTYALEPKVLGRSTKSSKAVADVGVDGSRLCLFGTRTRFVVMVVALLCLTSIWSNILSLNFAIICMEPPENGTAHADIDYHTYTNVEKTWITSAVAISALVSNLVVSQLVNRFGIRVLFTILGLLSGVATLLLPTAIRWGYAALIVCRVAQGVAFSANFPVIGAFGSKWTYYKQTGLFVSVLVAYTQLAPAVTMPLSGALCAAFQWPSVFYAHGSFCVVIFLIFGFFYRNSPKKHPCVGTVEQAKIDVKKAVIDKAAAAKIPYAAIFKTPAIWAFWLAGVGNFFAVNLTFLYEPIYLSAVLGYSTHETGLSGALPAVAQFFMKLICGWLSDRLRCVSEGTRLRGFNTFSFFGSATCFIVLAFMNTENPQANMILLAVGAGLLGATTGGFFKAGPLMSKQFSHFVTGNISIVITLTMLVVPFLVNWLAHDNTQAEWKWIFLITALIQIVTNIIFVIFVQGEPCEWTEVPPSRRETVV